MTFSRDARAVPAVFLTSLVLIACAPGNADRASGESTAMTSDDRATTAPARPGSEPAGEVLATRNAPITLDKASTTVSMEVPPALPESVGGGERLGLYLEGLELEKAGVYFDVYANLPEGRKPDPGSPHYVGALSSFGPPGAKVGYDITQLVHKLEAAGSWTGDLKLTFVRRGLEPPPGQPGLESVPDDVPPVRIRRVRIVRE